MRPYLLPVLVLTVALPNPASGQLRPRIRPGGSDPTRPQPMPPQAEPVARTLAYQRLRLAVETVPLVDHVRAAGFTPDGRIGSWTAVGIGTRADFRITQRWAAVAGMTSAWAGSPVATFSAELGTRFRPYRLTGRAQPFLDARANFAFAEEPPFREFSATRDPLQRIRSSGFGALAGAGMEYMLSPRWSVVTSGALAHNRMRASDVFGGDTHRFGMTTFRMSLGVRYNRVRAVTMQDAGGR